MSKVIQRYETIGNLKFAEVSYAAGVAAKVFRENGWTLAEAQQLMAASFEITSQSDQDTAREADK